MSVRSPQKPNARSAANRQDLDNRPKSRRRVLLGLILVMLAVLLVGWLSGGFASWPLVQARHALATYDLEAAEQWISRSDVLRGSTVEVEWLKARLARKHGDFARMETHLERALTKGLVRQRAMRERMLAAAQTGQLAEVEDAIRGWMVDPEQEEPEIYDAYVNGLTMLGRIPDAQMLLEGWQRDFPQDAEPLYRRGRIFEHLLAQEEAEKSYREALKRNPRHASTLYALGRMLLDRKQPEEALPYFRECAEHCAPAAPTARVGEAGCLILLGQSDEARRLLEQTVALDESQRSRAYARVREVSEVDPAFLELGKLESSDGHYESAERLLRKCVEQNSRDPEIRYAYAVALRGVGRVEEAQREFKYVTEAREALAQTDLLFDRLQDYPADAEARCKIGVAYLKYRSERAGLYWLQSALSHDPDHVPSHQALADYYEQKVAESPGFAQLARFHRESSERPSSEGAGQKQ